MERQRMPSSTASRPDAPPLEWYAQSVDQILVALETSASGLSDEEAARRFTRYGPNELQAFAGTSAWKTLADQFKNVLILILLLATVLSGVLGHALEAVVIAIIVFFAVLL